ncbi:MAG: hypothetical protein QXU67_04310, partial [Candidatus Bathyarchaeia archaeon]
IFAAGVVSFSSPSQDLVVRIGYSQSSASYNGLLIKRFYGYPPDSRGGVFGTPILEYLKILSNGEFSISPRIWLYPTSIHPYGVSESIVNPKGVIYTMYPFAYLGLSKEEMEAIFGDHLSAGFIPNAPRTCIVSEGLARVLNVTIGDSIYLRSLGLSFRIMGIFTSFVMDRLTDF